MNLENNQKWSFKGNRFSNRYKITGILKTQSPLHVGDGRMDSDKSRLKHAKKEDQNLEYSTVMTDHTGAAYIPGTTLKGNLRSWLDRIFSHPDFGLGTVNDHKRAKRLYDIIEPVETDEQAGEKSDNALTERLRSELKMTEYLFGSGANEGKLEIWDAPMIKKPAGVSDKSGFDICGYDPKRGTILLKSVAINPITGTAADKKLYNYEVVPEGACFRLTVAGQNLGKDEIGMLLFALYGFNSQIYPVTMGAMGGVGFGRFSFELEKVHCLGKENFKEWIKTAMASGHAGYSAIPEIEESECKQRIETFKQSFLKNLEQGEKA